VAERVDGWAGSEAARWLSIAMRTLHLCAVAWTAAALLGAPVARNGALLLLAASGAAMLTLDLAGRRIRLDELAGAVVLAKLALVAAMWAWPSLATWLFWALVVASSLSSHAPRPVRHWRPGRGG
jgi:hypothetical protein